MKNFIEYINSDIYTLSAIIIGYALIDENTPAIQNSIGNWFMLIGQVLCTNSAQQQVINNKNNTSNNTNNHIINSDLNINDLKKVVDKMNYQLNKLQDSSNI